MGKCQTWKRICFYKAIENGDDHRAKEIIEKDQKSYCNLMDIGMLVGLRRRAAQNKKNLWLITTKSASNNYNSVIGYIF